MTINAADPETKYDGWLIGMRNTKQAKQEIPELFLTELDDEHVCFERTVKKDHPQVKRSCSS